MSKQLVKSVKTMIVVKLIVFVTAAVIGSFSVGSIFVFLAACCAGFAMVKVVEPGWGRVTALLPPFGALWLLSTFLLPGTFHAVTSALQLLALAFVFGVPLDAIEYPVQAVRRKQTHALAKRDDTIIDAEVVDD